MVKTKTIANRTNKPKYQVDAIVAALKNKDDKIRQLFTQMKLKFPNRI